MKGRKRRQGIIKRGEKNKEWGGVVTGERVVFLLLGSEANDSA